MKLETKIKQITKAGIFKKHQSPGPCQLWKECEAILSEAVSAPERLWNASEAEPPESIEAALIGAEAPESGIPWERFEPNALAVLYDRPNQEKNKHALERQGWKLVAEFPNGTPNQFGSGAYVMKKPTPKSIRELGEE